MSDPLSPRAAPATGPRPDPFKTWCPCPKEPHLVAVWCCEECRGLPKRPTTDQEWLDIIAARLAKGDGSLDAIAKATESLDASRAAHSVPASPPPEPAEERTQRFCNKCGSVYEGPPTHDGCSYLAATVEECLASSPAPALPRPEGGFRVEFRPPVTIADTGTGQAVTVERPPVVTYTGQTGDLYAALPRPEEPEGFDDVLRGYGCRRCGASVLDPATHECRRAALPRPEEPATVATRAAQWCLTCDAAMGEPAGVNCKYPQLHAAASAPPPRPEESALPPAIVSAIAAFRNAVAQDDSIEASSTRLTLEREIRRALSAPPPGEERLRPEVFAFARVMSGKLDGHNHDRGEHGWRAARPIDLLDWLHRYWGDLQDAVRAVDFRGEEEARSRVLAKAANVANLAMMIADVAGPRAALREDEKGAKP
jgi:hypothetical protein